MNDATYHVDLYDPADHLNTPPLCNGGLATYREVCPPFGGVIWIPRTMGPVEQRATLDKNIEQLHDEMFAAQ